MSRYKPGSSGNPSGRPRAASFVARLIRSETSDCAELVQLVCRVARGTEPGMQGPRSREWAIEWLANRGLGKPIESVEMEISVDAPLPDVRGMSLDELRQLADEEPHRGPTKADWDRLTDTELALLLALENKLKGTQPDPTDAAALALIAHDPLGDSPPLQRARLAAPLPPVLAPPDASPPPAAGRPVIDVASDDDTARGPIPLVSG